MHVAVAALAVAAAAAAATADATTIARFTLPELERTATVVLIGDVRARRRVTAGGSLPASRHDFARVRFLRGGPARSVTLTSLELPGIELGLVRGDRFLVFAEPRRLGRERERRLVPVGYPQGIYRVLASDIAANDVNGRVSLSRLERRLRAGRSGE